MWNFKFDRNNDVVVPADLAPIIQMSASIMLKLFNQK